MKNNILESVIGGIVILLTILFLLFSFKIVNINSKSQTYNIYGEFDNIEGINIGTDVKISGIKIGNVSNIKLNKSFKAYLTFSISKEYKIPNDSIFKVATSGLIGNKFIDVKIGANDEFIENGEIADFTESTMNLEDLISKFVFNSEKKNEKK